VAKAASKSARFPARKTLEEFDFTFQRSVKKTVIQHLGQLDFLRGRENVILIGPPGTGKTRLAIASGIRACLSGQRVIFKRPNESRCSPTSDAKAASTRNSNAWSATRC
jgi:DNA replication protein DnaC